MPTYEYRCKDCDHQFDAVQSFTDDALTECPACGGVLRKVFGSVGITFKGSGFYKTDSRAGGSKSDSGDESGERSPEKAGASKDGGGKDGSTNGSSGKDSAASTSSDSGKGGSGSSDAGKSGKDRDSKTSRPASKAPSTSGSGT